MDRIRQLWYLFPGYRRRLSAQEGCVLKKMPTELVDMILEHLEPESAIALALTCRALFVKHFAKYKSAQLSAPARATILQLLERDSPTLYFCHDCARLHRWRVTRQFAGYKFYDRPCSNRPDIMYPAMSKWVSSFRPDFTYSWARLVMNRHFYSPHHGPPPPVIDNVKVNPPCSFGNYYGVLMTDSWRVKIIGNSLHLHGTSLFQSDGKKGDAHSLRAFINHFRDSLVCCHLETATISELHHEKTCSIPFHPTPGSGTIKSCAVCFTDYQVRVTLAPARGDSSRRRTTWGLTRRRREPPIEGGDWSVQINRWHNLGQFRSPDDLEWHNLVTISPDRTTKRREWVCEAGAVHGAWMEEATGPIPVTRNAVFSNSGTLIW